MDGLTTTKFLELARDAESSLSGEDDGEGDNTAKNDWETDGMRDNKSQDYA